MPDWTKAEYNGSMKVQIALAVENNETLDIEDEDKTEMIQIGQLNRNHINMNNYKVINQNNNKFINSDDARDEEADKIIKVRNKKSQSLI